MVICLSCKLANCNPKFSFIIFMDICHLQNDLEEFYAMVNFTNPGILGEIANFRRYYEVH